MLYPEFAAAYPVTMPENEIHTGGHAAYMREAQDYSYKNGLLLHAILRQDASIAEPFDAEEMTNYLRWAWHGGIDDTIRQLNEAPSEARNHGLNELNFHVLNATMSDFWIPLAGGGWKNDAERYDALNKTQDFLALRTLDCYMDRENLISAANGTEILYDNSDPGVVDEHATLTGIIQEYDAALILMEVMRKHKHLAVVPAPLQFERSQKRTNVDFVVADFIGQRAVGVQVKSRFRQRDLEVADPDRVVFIHGDTDLGNIRVRRVQRGQPTEHVKSWPGIVGVKHISRLKSYGQRGRHLWPNSRALPVLKQVSDKLTRDLKVDHTELARTIGTRILEKL